MKARWHELRVNLAAHPIAWPLLRGTRYLGRVLRIPGLIVINDVQLAHEILLRDRDFAKNGPRTFSEIVTTVVGPLALINMDGDDHQRLRSKLASTLSPGNSEALLRFCSAPLEQMRDALRSGATVDLATFMQRLGARVAIGMLGVEPPPGEEQRMCDEFASIGQRITRILGLMRPSQSQLDSARQDCGILANYVRQAYESDTQDTSILVRRLREIGLSFEEAKGLLLIMFLAGTQTSAAALPRIVALLIDSEQFEALRQRPDTISNAISEGLRMTTPAPVTMRIAQRTVELQGHVFRRGSRILISTCNIARDAHFFANPNRFDSQRAFDSRVRNLWFGAGPHFCLGFALAQRLLHMVMTALLAAPCPLTITKRRAAHGVLIPSYSRLDVRSATDSRA